MMATAKQVIRAMESFEGYNERDGSFKKILKIYNNHRPLAKNYIVKPTDEWCATTVSASFIKANAVKCIGGTECGVQRFIDEIFRPKGIWIEDGSIKPKAGDIICYNWDDATQPNNGWADHIGLVTSVGSTHMIVLEGNYGEVCKKRRVPIGWGYIRGFARPKYTGLPKHPPKGKKSVATVAREVLAGKWGNGTARKEKLEKAGYDYQEVQKAVNKLSGSKYRKSYDEIAREVVQGKWGNGKARKRQLEQAGYDYQEVMKRVNKF